MTDYLKTEDRIPLGALAEILGVGHKTVTRWADHGYRGERLANFRIGRKRYSTHQEAQRFLAAVNGDVGLEQTGSQKGGQEAA
jgi:transposase